MVAGVYLVSCTLWCGWGVYVLVRNPPGAQSPFTKMGVGMIVTAPVWPLVVVYQTLVGAWAVLSYLAAPSQRVVRLPRVRPVPRRLSTTLPISWW